MSPWKSPARVSLLAATLAFGCQAFAPLEPLPEPMPHPSGGFAGTDGDSGGGTAGTGGASGEAGTPSEGGSGSGRGGRTGGTGGEAGGAAGTGAGGSAAGGGKGGQGGSAGSDAQGGSGGGAGSGAGGRGGSGGDAGDGGADDVCDPANVPYAAAHPEARRLEGIESLGPLGVTARSDPVVVPRDLTFPNRYRAFVLNARNEFVYAILPQSPFPPPDPGDPPPRPEWIRIGSGDDYLFSPPAVASTPDRMWVFGIAADRILHYSVSINEGSSDGPWTAPRWNGAGSLSEIWSTAAIKLSDEGFSASVSGFGNVLIAARCYDHRTCIGIQPVELMDSLGEQSFLQFEIESDFQPAAIEAATDPESPSQVHVAVTDKDGIIHYGVGSAGTGAVLRAADFAWTQISGMCFESAPVLVAGNSSIDLFARGTDGAIYRRPLQGSEGLTRISPIVDTHPLVISEGASGLLVFAVTRGGQSAAMRRFWSGGWTDWDMFDDYVPLLGSANRPFPGAALKVGTGVRLVVRTPASELKEYSFAEGQVNQ